VGQTVVLTFKEAVGSLTSYGVKVDIREEILNLLIDSFRTLDKIYQDGSQTKVSGKILRDISDLHARRGEINRLACQLDSSQVEQMGHLLESYRESLERVSTFDDEERYDFFVGLIHDIKCDMSRLIKDYEIQKKKQRLVPSYASGELKVTEKSHLFCS
jgi:hypothetical protein